MYCCSASSWEVPFNLFQASHLYLPLKSKTPGFSVSLSPTVACLYKPYNFKSSSSDGLVGRSLTAAAYIIYQKWEWMVLVLSFRIYISRENWDMHTYLLCKSFGNHFVEYLDSCWVSEDTLRRRTGCL